jgi:hypothetical protein
LLPFFVRLLQIQMTLQLLVLFAAGFSAVPQQQASRRFGGQTLPEALEYIWQGYSGGTSTK